MARKQKPSQQDMPELDTQAALSGAAARQDASGLAKHVSRDAGAAPRAPWLLDDILRDRPGYLVRRLHQTSVSIFAQEMAQFDLTPVQYSVLAVVVEQPGIDQVSAAEMVGVDRTTIVGVIDRLARKGLMTRSVADYDKRARVLKSTRVGEKLMARVAIAAEAVRLRLLEPLSDAESALFCELMERVIAYHRHAGGPAAA